MSRNIELEQAKTTVRNAIAKSPLIRNNGVEVDETALLNASETEIDAMLALVQRRNLTDRSSMTYQNRRLLEERINEFWHFISESRLAGKNIIPDFELLVSFLGVAKSTVTRWIRDDMNGFAEPLEMAKNDIAAIKNQLALRGEIPPMVWIAMMNNVHGYTQNTRVEVTSNRGNELLDRDSLLDQVAALSEDMTASDE